jgi:hypothetical protein
MIGAEIHSGNFLVSAKFDVTPVVRAGQRGRDRPALLSTAMR